MGTGYCTWGPNIISGSRISASRNGIPTKYQVGIPEGTGYPRVLYPPDISFFFKTLMEACVKKK